MKRWFSGVLDGREAARKRSAAQWVAARDGEGVDPQGFNAWRRAHPDNAKAYAKLNALWEDPALTEALGRAQRVSGVRSAVRPRLAGLAPTALAAALAVAMLPLAWPTIELIATRPMEQRTLPGQRLSLALKDGSRLDLAGDTWVRIRETPHRRQVELMRGEAYFDVAHEQDRPFHVLTADSRVEVVGTRFDVNLTAGRTELSVEQGRVRFGARGFLAQSHMVEAGRTTAVTATGVEPLRPLQPGAAGDWRDGWIETSGMSVARLVEEMNRWSTEPIRVADPELGAMTVAGRFRITAPERTLSNLARLHSFGLGREDGALVLRRHTPDSKAS